MNPYLCIIMGTPRRLLGTLAGLLVLLAIISPEAFNWLMLRAFNALWPWAQVVGMILVGVGIIMALLPKSSKGGGKKDG
ncbi:MAG: hypothetical protein UX58_C0003G0040 [Candidatus Wolfebacteria bacterium GW2011_GWB2_46_69]|nr:MAG: hypothetical protein UX58_C0003G0040 [Candidatus Wolfebacteria bacterium GW2011_GWB2_46_69]KKU59295.1 MAG: hypothetical protein UX83_C0006G0065 [Candidatus Wolfebacteria bacterium GW2011_GWE2_47_12]KKU75478.1 MAG: hypothetical protein UY00_C0041G0005 [Candidatus Wolfebacteria bacterium GW2011_GWA1_47_6]